MLIHLSQERKLFAPEWIKQWNQVLWQNLTEENKNSADCLIKPVWSEKRQRKHTESRSLQSKRYYTFGMAVLWKTVKILLISLLTHRSLKHRPYIKKDVTSPLLPAEKKWSQNILDTSTAILRWWHKMFRDVQMRDWQVRIVHAQIMYLCPLK